MNRGEQRAEMARLAFTRRVAYCLAAAMLVAAMPAGAQKKDDADVRRIVADFGRCMVRHYHDRLRTFVLSSDDSIRPPAPLAQCIGVEDGGTLRMSGAIYRMVFAEALIRKDFPNGVPQLTPSEAPKDGAATGPRGVVHWGETVSRLDALGRCVAFRDTAGSYRLLATPASSGDEDAEVKRLMPTLTACGVAGVLPQPINNIRGTIAVNLYRVAAGTAPVAAAAAPGGN